MSECDTCPGDYQRVFPREASTARRAQDLYLGAKLALTVQRQYLPAIALIPQMTVPAGSRAVSITPLRA